MRKELQISNFKSQINQGFTLIELILVTAVSAILLIAILAVLNPLEQIAKSNDTRRKSDLVQIQRVLETYYQDNGSYPDSSSAYKIKNSAGVEVDWGGSFQPYMNILPKDPRGSSHYAYWSDGQTYYLYASLDRGTKDAQACNSGNACSSLSDNSIPTTACGGTCNFGLSSPNTQP